MTNHTDSLPDPFLGCPIWTHPRWKSNGLSSYGQFCNSIEGNTTFYQTPTQERAHEWAKAVPKGFSFSFKLPQVITHEKALEHCEHDLLEFWEALAPLHHKVGILMAQLPARFGPERLAQLQVFLEQYSLPVKLAIEVRHPQFFAKGEAETRLNRLLMEHGVNRVILDSRALFSEPPTTEIEREVQGKKPKLPVNVIATDSTPIVRFIGGNNDQINEQMMLPWLKKCHQWRTQGMQPYLFFHRPDNAGAPFLLKQFVDLYNQHYPQHPLTCQLSALFPDEGQGALAF